jgi:AraC-like DNA-binding protein
MLRHVLCYGVSYLRHSGSWPMMLEAHRHRELECNLVLRGRIDYRIGNQRMSLRAGDLCWLLQQHAHQNLWHRPESQMWVVVFAEQTALPEKPLPATWLACDPSPDEQVSVAHVRRHLDDAICRQLAQLCQSLQITFEQPTEMQAGYSWLLHSFWRAFMGAPEDAAERVLSRPVLEAIDWLEHWLCDERADSLEHLAADIGVSRSWISRRFHQECGCTLLDYRNGRRLERAMILYQQKRGPHYHLMQAAMEAGFGSYAQFYRMYVKRYGQPPSLGELPVGTQ